jgi:hypothetical protein
MRSEGSGAIGEITPPEQHEIPRFLAKSARGTLAPTLL